jgi:uncharacterized damage-inducible protein DinB
MDTRLQLLVSLADDEFDGECFNGLSFMKTLEKLGPEAAARTDTYEGYSAWGVALHVAYYKYFIAKSLGVAGMVSYPFDEGTYGFGAPSAVSAEAWKAVRDYLRTAHKKVWDAARKLSPARLDETMPELKIPYARALAWLATHDTFHVAQIRSMGVAGFKEKRP